MALTMLTVKYSSAPAVLPDLQRIRTYTIMIQGNMRTSMYLKIIEIIYDGLVVAKPCPYGIVWFNMSPFLSFEYTLRKHVLSDESILNED